MHGDAGTGRAGRRVGRGRRGRALTPEDLVTIAPLIVAVLTAAAVLIVDLIWPSRSPLAIATALIGLGITAVVILVVGATPATAFGGSYTVDALTTFLDILFVVDRRADHPVRPGLPAATQPADRRVRDRPDLRDDRRDAHRRRPPTCCSCSSGLELMVLPGYMLAGYHKTDSLLDRGRDQVLPAGLVQLGHLPVRARVRVGPDRDDPGRRRRRRPWARSWPGNAPLSPGLAMGLAFLTTGVAFKIAAVPVPLLDTGRVPGLADARSPATSRSAPRSAPSR